MSRQENSLDVSQAASKEELIRILAKLRLKSDPQAAKAGLTDKLDTFSKEELEALPESTIVNIVDAYFILKKKKVSDNEIFKRIEMQRSLFGDSVVLPGNLTPKRYIKYRLKMEHPHIESLEDVIVEMEIRYAVHWCSARASGARDWRDVDKFAEEAITTVRGKSLELLQAEEAVFASGQAEAAARKAGRFRKFAIGTLISIIALALIAWAAYRFIYKG